MQIWLALATTFTFFGTAWQMGVAMLNSIDEMESFLGDFNLVAKEESKRRAEQFPRWRIWKRRRATKEALAESTIVLSKGETLQFKAYDRQAWGWAFLTVEAIIVAVASWVDFASSHSAAG